MTAESLVEQCLQNSRLDLQKRVESLSESAAFHSVDEKTPETSAATMTPVPSSSAAVELTSAVGYGKGDDQDGDGDNYNDSDDGYDPDDLAAAFFAKQAQKQQRLNKLPIKGWALCVVNYGQNLSTKRSNKKGDQEAKNANVGSDGKTDGISIRTSNKIDATEDFIGGNAAPQLSKEEVENLAKQLFVDFKKIISSS